MKIGPDVSVRVAILAPLRTVTSVGATNFVDDPSQLAELWAKTVTLNDYTILQPAVKGPGSPLCP